jgi:hypothetical protein
MHTSSRIGDTTSSKTIFWSAAGEKTLSNWYVLLLSALEPMESSTVLPLIPFVETTTPLFSRTSRSLRPRHRTTTLILVSSPTSSYSRSFRFSGEDRGALEVDATDSARDERPSLNAGVAERPRDNKFGREAGGRIVEVVRLTCGGPGRGRPDMADYVYAVVREPVVSSYVVLCSVLMEHNNCLVIVYALTHAGTIPGRCSLELGPHQAPKRRLLHICITICHVDIM